MRIITAFLITFFLASLSPLTAGEKGFVLQDGDIVAVCGDSITSSGRYPIFMEAYHRMCAPRLKVEYKNFGRWGWRARGFEPTIEKSVLPSNPTIVTFCYGMNSSRRTKVFSTSYAEKGWGGVIRRTIDIFRKAGVRHFVLGSPGCVDSKFFNQKNVEATNKNLSLLRDAARKIAKEEKVIFVDVHTPMIEVMAKAKKKYGENFAFAGGGGDGIHPHEAGHLVMAWCFLKGLGYDGNIGTFNVDLGTKKAEATTGHKVLAFDGKTLSIESTRYPFCFYRGRKGALDSYSTRSVAELFPFNEDLNRLMLVVKGSKSKSIKITWGKNSKTFTSEELSKGVNLAAIFIDTNPFHRSFSKIYHCIRERTRLKGFLRQDGYKNNEGFKARIQKEADGAKNVLPVKHTILIEAGE